MKQSTAGKENTTLKGRGCPRLPNPRPHFPIWGAWLEPSLGPGDAPASGCRAGKRPHPQPETFHCPAGAAHEAYHVPVLSVPSRCYKTICHANPGTLHSSQAAARARNWGKQNRKTGKKKRRVEQCSEITRILQQLNVKKRASAPGCHASFPEL